MTEFFKWWYTNNEGLEYMTLLGCSMNDLPIVILTCLLSFIVLYQYAIIGRNAYKEAKKHPNSVTKSYLLDKTNVFVLCAVTGYGYTILSAFVNPYKLRILLLIILILWTYRFIKSAKNTKVLQRIFEAEKVVEQKLRDYGEMKAKFSADEGDGLITYNELLQTKFNTWIDLGNGVRFMRVLHPEKPVYFITVMNPETSPNNIAEFGLQWHDCRENCGVLKGHLIDLYDEDKIYKEGDIAHYKAFKKHKPVAKVFSIYEVEFYI